jgi:hypothetical protein
MKLHAKSAPFILLCIVVVFAACQSSTAVYRDVAKEVCDLYQPIRGAVVAVRPVIAAGFESYPPHTQTQLRYIDSQLPKLDAIGKASCAIATPDQGLGILKANGIDGWDVARTIVKNAVPVLAELKKQGVI